MTIHPYIALLPRAHVKEGVCDFGELNPGAEEMGRNSRAFRPEIPPLYHRSFVERQAVVQPFQVQWGILQLHRFHNSLAVVLHGSREIDMPEGIHHNHELSFLLALWQANAAVERHAVDGAKVLAVHIHLRHIMHHAGEEGGIPRRHPGAVSHHALILPQLLEGQGSVPLTLRPRASGKPEERHLYLWREGSNLHRLGHGGGLGNELPLLRQGSGDNVAVLKILRREVALLANGGAVVVAREVGLNRPRGRAVRPSRQTEVRAAVQHKEVEGVTMLHVPAHRVKRFA